MKTSEIVFVILVAVTTGCEDAVPPASKSLAGSDGPTAAASGPAPSPAPAVTPTVSTDAGSGSSAVEGPSLEKPPVEAPPVVSPTATILPVDTTPPGSFEIIEPSRPILTSIGTITWSAADGATAYNALIASDAACGASLASATGLTATHWTPSTTLAPGSYYLCITAQDAAANVRAATPVSVTLAEAHHKGWSEVVATGALLAVDGQEAAPKTLRFAWKPMETNAGTPDGYRIYRSQAAGELGAVVAANVSAGTRSHTDSTAVPGETYYYTVAAMKGDLVLRAPESFAQIRIMAPPANKALVHRWMANRETCASAGRTSDPALHESCAYDGPGSEGGRMDLGHSLLVDIVEAGCAYTPPPGCGDAVNGCRGATVPNNGVGNVGDVFFVDGANAPCHIKGADGVWKSSAHTSSTDPTIRTLTDAEAARMATSRAGAPLLRGYFTPSDVQAACAGQTSGVSGAASRLLSRREALAASAWSEGLTRAEVDDLETGVATGGCSDIWLTSDVMSGDASQAACVSRYGIRGLIGNFEVNSDQVICDYTAQSCTGVESALVPGNRDLEGIDFGDAWGAIQNAGNFYVNGWSLRSEYVTRAVSYFNVPLGLPVRSAATNLLDATPTGSATGEFAPAAWGASELVQDARASWGPFSASFPRMVLSGGKGRYGMSARFHVADVWITFRCGTTVTGD